MNNNQNDLYQFIVSSEANFNEFMKSKDISDDTKKILRKRRDDLLQKEEVTGPNMSEGASNGESLGKQMTKVAKGYIPQNRNPFQSERAGFMDAWFLGLLTLIIEPLMMIAVYWLFK